MQLFHSLVMENKEPDCASQFWWIFKKQVQDPFHGHMPWSLRIKIRLCYFLSITFKENSHSHYQYKNYVIYFFVFSDKNFLQVLCFYNSTSEKEKRGEILIDGQCRVESLPDSHSKSPLKVPGSKHHSKFQVRLSSR